MIATDRETASTANYVQLHEYHRWSEFVERHSRSSIFHTVGWLEALRRTYGYEPIVLTTSPAGRELQNGLVLCQVNSWWTGRRLVSVPFADHCEPLVNDADEFNGVLSALAERLVSDRLL